MVAAMSAAVWGQESFHPLDKLGAGSVSPKAGETRVGYPATSEKVPTIKFEKYKLANGLEVILSEDHRLPLTAVDLWYHVGPANERPGLTGFAHLFEHMMFQGSKHVPNFDKVIEGIGATESNGTTDFDRTNYFETVPSDQLETALWVESDRMGWLLDGLNETKLKNQRDVVRNERRQSLEGRPYGLVEEGLYHLVYPKTHPYYAEVIGSHADVEAADLKDVREFFKTYYAPNNATIAIVGDFDTKTVKAMMEKYFGPIPKGPPVPKIEAVTPPITHERRAVVTDKVQLPRVYIAWLTPAYFKPGDADADLLASILGGGKSSRLYKKLVYEKQIAQDVRAYQQSMMLGSLFQIEATAKPGVKPEELEKAIEDELAAVQTHGVTQAEVERARNTIETRTIQGLQRLGGFGGKADLLNQYNHYTGDPGYLAKDLARYDSATTASVQKLAQALTANSRAVVYGEPGEKVVNDVPQRPEPAATAEKMPGGPGRDEWRNTQPKPGKSSALQLPVPEEFKLPNGMQVYLVEQHDLPVLTAQLTVLRGSDANPPGRPGLASFTAQMMNEGTESRTSPQLADDIAQIGASLNAASSADASTVTGAGLTKNADKLFDLLSDVALHPAFRAEEIERVRKLRLTTLLQQNDNPGILANRVFVHEVYGDKSPYGFLETGTPESTQATTREDLVQFYKGGFAPDNCALVVAGDVTELQLKKLAMKYFAWWTGRAASSKAPMAANTLTRRVVIVDKPNAPQSALRIGQVGLARSHPDYVPLTVMNDILGGMFSSRINMNLREVHGYTYGAFSQFQFRRGTGPFVVGSMIRTDVTAPAVKEVFAELERMRSAEVSPGELSAAKETFERGLTADFETTTRTAGTMSNLFVYGLPPDYYRTLPMKIAAVNAAEVQQMAERHLAPDRMVIVIAGDRAKVEPELKKLELGTVEAQDVDGKPIVEQKAAGGGM
jgi:zinc protease